MSSSIAAATAGAAETTLARPTVGCDGDQHAHDLVDRRPRRERHGGVPLVRGRSGIEGNERAQAHERMRLRVKPHMSMSSSCSERTSR